LFKTKPKTFKLTSPMEKQNLMKFQEYQGVGKIKQQAVVKSMGKLIQAHLEG
jgi:hypothetical protein